MSRLKRVVVSVVSMILAIISPIGAAPIMAADESAATYFPMTVPLMVTSYKMNAAGTDFEVLELYNNGSAAVDLGDYIVRDVTNGRSLDFTSGYRGVMVPGSHIIVSVDDSIVKGATYRIAGWDNVVVGPAAIRSLRIERQGYRPFETTLLVGPEIINRTVGASGYSTATTAGAYAMHYRQASPAYPGNYQWFDDGLYAAPIDVAGLSIIELYPYSSSCSPFDTSVLCGDYIKITNAGEIAIDLSDYVLRTDSSSANRTGANTFSLAGTLQPGETYLVHRTDAGGAISLTNSGGYVWFEDIWGIEQYIDTAAHYESAGSSRQGYSYALAEDGTWQWTSTPQPYGDNTITVPIAEAAPCPEGKYRNPDTNRCRNIEDVISDLVPCGEGKERSPETNRCRNIASSASSLTPCKEGQERNPATNRCRSIASAIAELLPCDEGYERNPATNRCRKVKDANVLGAEYPVEPYKQEGVALATWWAVGGIAALAVGYGVWEWRREIGAGLARVLRRGK